jgi:hypothetical protein
LREVFEPGGFAAAPGGDFAVEGVEGLVGGLAGETVLPTVRYLGIFSSRLGPMPLMARKSSTLLKKSPRRMD